VTILKGNRTPNRNELKRQLRLARSRLEHLQRHFYNTEPNRTLRTDIRNRIIELEGKLESTLKNSKGELVNGPRDY
jgi:hypothetical protein